MAHFASPKSSPDGSPRVSMNSGISSRSNHEVKKSHEKCSSATFSEFSFDKRVEVNNDPNVMEGYMHKLGEIFKAWKARYFYFNRADSVLFSYENHSKV